MINWKSLGIGLALAIAIFYMFISYNLQTFLILSFIIAPLIGGYVVGGSPKIGTIHGAIIGLVGSAIDLLSFIALVSYFSATPLSPLSILIPVLLIRIVFYGVVGAVMGAVGAAIKNKMMERK